MKIDFTKVDIKEQEDLDYVKEQWHYFVEDISPDKYINYLKQLNVIVGFGRGFWPGVHDYFYLVYHKKNNKFYWFLKDEHTDNDIYFYEIKKDANIFELLQNESMDSEYELFCDELNFDMLYSLSKGETESITEELTPVTLSDVFGEDSYELRTALSFFRPASQYSKYPHLEFQKKYFLPAYNARLDEKIKKYNNKNFRVFRIEDELFIDLAGDVYKLSKSNK